MNAAGLDARLLVPRPGRLILRLSLGVAIPLVVSAVTVLRSGQPIVALFCALFLAAQVASAVTTAHKEIIAATPSYFQPGLRRRLLSAQLTWAVGAAVLAAALLGLLQPGMTPLRAATTFGAVLTVYGLLALATLHLAWAFQIPIWMFYLWPLAKDLDRLAKEGRVDGVFDSPLPWLAAAVLLLVLVGRSLLSPRLHRRLHGTIVLGWDDIFRSGRVCAFKQQRGRHAFAGQGPVWRRRLIGFLLQRAVAAGLRGRTEVARIRQLQALVVAVVFSGRTRAVALVVVGAAAMMLFFGYYDGRGRGESLDGWFAGLVYQVAAWPFFSLAQVLLSAPRPSVSRRTGFRAEAGLVGRLAFVALGASLLTAATFGILASVLPPVSWGGQEAAFTAPRLHGVWLVPLLAPFAWLAVAARPRPQNALPAFAMGLFFIVGHVLMSKVPYRASVPIFAAASLAALAAASVLRRRWWRCADHA